MSSRSQRIFAVIIVAGFLVLAVSLCDISVHSLATAGAFQNAGQDMSMVTALHAFENGQNKRHELFYGSCLLA